MRGHVHRRGRTWSYVVDIGRDPESGRRRQRTQGGFATRREAEELLARLVAGVDVAGPTDRRSASGGTWSSGCPGIWRR